MRDASDLDEEYDSGSSSHFDGEFDEDEEWDPNDPNPEGFDYEQQPPPPQEGEFDDIEGQGEDGSESQVHGIKVLRNEGAMNKKLQANGNMNSRNKQRKLKKIRKSRWASIPRELQNTSAREKGRFLSGRFRAGSVFKGV